MWLAKLSWKHDCILGNRCKKFKVIAVGYPLDFYQEKNKWFYLHFEKLIGEENRIKKFFNDLKKDPLINQLEIEKNLFFFSYEIKKKHQIPTAHYSKKIFFLKPVIADENGYEHWEIGSWKRENLVDFIKETKKETKGLTDFKILKLAKSNLSEVYFPQILPNLSLKQKAAVELASELGYYDYPRKAGLKELSKRQKLSLSTFREHLRKAEKKILSSASKNL